MNIDEFSKNSQLMKEILPKIEKFAPYNSSILITGERGTEKELIARIIHQLSHRSKNEFISIKCNNLNETILEREIFGCEPEAFHDIIMTQKGKIEYANDGTIYLDGISDLSPNLQLKLFNFIDSGYFQRVGGNQNIKSDIRFIASSDLNLKDKTESGNFREDLFYKINIFNLNITPLRKRPEDIVLWAVYYVNLYSKKFNKEKLCFTSDSYRLLTKYNWPGNILEIRNIVERAVVLSMNGKISSNELNIDFCNNILIQEDDIKSFFGIDLFLKMKISLPEFLDRIEESIIESAIKESGHIQVKAAELLGITKSLLQYKLKKYNIFL